MVNTHIQLRPFVMCAEWCSSVLAVVTYYNDYKGEKKTRVEERCEGEGDG